ncbi:G protein-coupled glucose receptor regulating Gpa2-domain-containing protein [Durotheca rogersii]|uniref:G protein-coupled glucose receptor regulating Gpa2-domain-containing protein n=1 Tax=Durotheca rogersii TaxID=419775 RepID=UPI00221E4C53|nr:G protein-coupled glucose receptor regulating Gpa2-domain-containing protein [Durotheca rogersii]KAI5861956.1 G protein-coupled glucose receptor regulating Gpa2-domain-containing protein [Durotheca rogersii]
MAPLAALPDAAAVLTPRESSPRTPDPRDRQLLALMSVSLGVASISLVATLFAFYWFVRMRRSFRHDLILLLIQSDMIKVFWLAIGPLAYFCGASFDSQSALCQVSGFFLAVGIEASDIAILLLTAHTALSILRPQRVTAGAAAAGLLPYRRVVYVAWAAVSLLLATLVPATGGRFERADGGSAAYCYLPEQPTWYASALSWIPRYVIFGVIVATYTCLYVYVRFQIRRFGRDQRRASLPRGSDRGIKKHSRKRDGGSGGTVTTSPQRALPPPTPPIADHGGLLASARPSLALAAGERAPAAKGRQRSVASTISTLTISATEPKPPEQARRSSIRWNTVDFGGQDPTTTMLCESSLPAAVGPTSPTLLPVTPIDSPSPTYQAHNGPPAIDPCSPVRSPQHRAESPEARAPVPWTRSLSTGSCSPEDSVLRRVVDSISRRGTVTHIPTPASASGTSPPTAPDDERGHGQDGVEEEQGGDNAVYLSPAETDSAMRCARARQQRQLRLLFAYPAAFALAWAAPLACHAVQLSSPAPSSSGPPFALRLAAAATLCAAAAGDCVFFGVWERPWRHPRSGFWEGLGRRLRFPGSDSGRGWGIWSGGGSSNTGGGGGSCRGTNACRGGRPEAGRRSRKTRIRWRRMGGRSGEEREGGEDPESEAVRGSRRSSRDFLATATIAGVGRMSGITAATATAGATASRRREWWDVVDVGSIFDDDDDYERYGADGNDAGNEDDSSATVTATASAPGSIAGDPRSERREDESRA